LKPEGSGPRVSLKGVDALWRDMGRQTVESCHPPRRGTACQITRDDERVNGVVEDGLKAVRGHKVLAGACVPVEMQI
jgi:hypothetical protein